MQTPEPTAASECRKPLSQRIAVDHIVNHLPRVCHLPKGHDGPCSFDPERPAASVSTDLVSGVLELRLYVSGARTVSFLTKAEARAILDRLVALERDNEHAYNAFRELTEGDASRG